MGRGPCCEKMGLKKGPWTPEEDHILISHIQRYGHGNWRALPKQAGLFRCGKSCRLRWTNYLRPDIKRGNFSREEEDAIISLHQLLGNRWSAIAARLPGRTDNEIKNVWHTHLKKRLQPSSSSSETTSSSTTTNNKKSSTSVVLVKEEDALTLDDSFWTDMLMLQDDNNTNNLDSTTMLLDNFDYSNNSNINGGGDDGMDFWIRVLMEAGESPAF